MLHHRSLLRFPLAGLLAAALLFAAEVRSQTAGGVGASSNQPPKLVVSLYPGEFVGHEQVIRQFIRCGTNEFVFVVPDGLRTQAKPDGAIVMTAGDMSYHVCIRIAAPLPAVPEIREALQDRIAGQYVGAKSLEGFTFNVADREGTGFELRQELPELGHRLVRILWVPFKAGLMEFTLIANAKNAEAGRVALGMILLTFRSNEQGRLEIVERSDKS